MINIMSMADKAYRDCVASRPQQRDSDAIMLIGNMGPRVLSADQQRAYEALPVVRLS